ncbi:MAG: hypothetical protein QOE96_92 [Blastocatellia bacterium]|jgi:hypothetical protein|nr:hypothetical protein [Blastocatellia bacterium]
MRNVPLIVFLVLVVAACNLTDKFKKSGSSNSNSPSSSSGNPSKLGDDPVEQANPTAAQTATLANGQTVKWDQQGVTLSFPANWKKQEVRNESFSYGGDGAFFTAAISPLPQMESLTDVSLKAMYEAAKTNQKIGKYDEVRWLELDGLRGVGFRESKQEMPGDIRRLEWQAYRTYAGSTQLVTMILSTDSGNFAKHQDELYAILYSTKLVK